MHFTQFFPKTINCSSCFHKYMLLLFDLRCLIFPQVLEMVSTAVPEVFTDWRRTSAELTLTRLFQVYVSFDVLVKPAKLFFLKVFL